jgi:hypothetical protein
MNTRQIVEKYKELEEEIKELCRALDALNDEVGEKSKPYYCRKAL